MMNSWYNNFLNVLWWYFFFKKKFLFVFKFFIFIKSISIVLDLYFGYFPKIFQDTVFKVYFNFFYDYLNIFFLYWSNIFWLYIFLFILIFFFLPRFGILDNFEINNRSFKKKKDLNTFSDLPITFSSGSLLKDIFKRNVKDYNLLFSKYLFLKQKFFNKFKK